MAQTWHDLCFAHWPIDPALLRPFLPAGIELDLFDGHAWLGIAPFRMSGVRLRGLPPIPGASAFPELNVRTYARSDGRSGVWFLSLDARSPLAVLGARAWFRLPYFRARMTCERRGEWVHYSSHRMDPAGPSAEFAARYRPIGAARPAEPGTLEHFLTERYCLFAPGRRGELLTADVRHAPWPLQPAEWEVERNTMAPRAHGLCLPPVAPLLHFAERLDVRVHAPRRLAPARRANARIA